MIHLSPKTDIKRVQTLKPNIVGHLITALSPDIFLFIEGRLIRREIFQFDLAMMLKK
jgi:hypothetical protein